ncbi:glycosyltransferase [Arcticibacter sp.]|jgi:cellulose synthase/poly-beta-1,6-N-acetylglucosamine synthase-like glycosyltransferase|uniref:glycosyltransferase n=1 Tax=Arcticibacter sp. TaxID=1872630 RepID=UPI00388F3FAE
MIVLDFIWTIFQVLVGFYLVWPLILYLLWTIRSKSNNQQQAGGAAEQDYAVIVTAYEQTHTLPAVISSILELNYSNYHIYVVADKCDISNLNFDSSKISLLRPEVTLASNTKSHFYAIKRFVRPHTCLTIVDSDNLVHPEFLNELNRAFSRGYLAVQGLREAKNLDTTYACLDAARDIYYHHYDGKLLFEAGSSATLSGSGMAFSVNLYRECLEHRNIEGAGFDKVLQAAIVEKNYRIAFTDHAIVYDEKTSRSDQLVQQRSRWINTWFKYFYLGFKLVGKGLKNSSINQLLFGITLLRPPLFIFILLSGVCFLVNLWISPTTSMVWLLAFTSFVAGFYLALSKSGTDPRIFKSLKNIPHFMFYQIQSLLKSRKANQRSVATKHYHAESIDKLNKK